MKIQTGMLYIIFARYLKMVWIVKTADNRSHEIKNEYIGFFISNNKVVECRLKR